MTETPKEIPTPRTQAAINKFAASDAGVANNVIEESKKLERELIEAQKQLGECSGGYETLCKENAELRAELERVTKNNEKLRKYVRHKANCQTFLAMPDKKCTCGLRNLD